VICAAKLLARSGNGDLVFVHRSLDSMFDLLGGALAAAAMNANCGGCPYRSSVPVSGHGGGGGGARSPGPRRTKHAGSWVV
jgi:hypothetical protein